MSANPPANLPVNLPGNPPGNLPGDPPGSPPANALESSAIALDGVRIAFDDREVLRGVSFSVAPRETLVLLGETGTGKTLLLKMIAGLLRPDAGTIRVLGHDVTAMREPELLPFRRRLGFVFQESALFDSLTVADNVAYRLHEEGVDDDEIEARVDESLRFVEMEGAKDKLPGDLSGGMRRRVSIARALITNPPIVLYDSPTAGLDPVTAQTIITLILRLRDVYGVTSVLATQRIQDAFALANFRFAPETNRVFRVTGNGNAPAPGHAPRTRFLFLREGSVYFEGDQDAVAHSKDAFLERFLV
ncbi:MAG TPA: ATP-binding cassette domain-containing protein [Candidatus Acidoferrales bacterium]|nr:ATP-binding cassette domain-containing protein [Candidatus Acidoferrales bacterium]